MKILCKQFTEGLKLTDWFKDIARLRWEDNIGSPRIAYLAQLKPGPWDCNHAKMQHMLPRSWFLGPQTRQSGSENWQLTLPTSLDCHQSVWGCQCRPELCSCMSALAKSKSGLKIWFPVLQEQKPALKNHNEGLVLQSTRILSHPSLWVRHREIHKDMLKWATRNSSTGASAMFKHSSPKHPKHSAGP